MSLKVEDRYGGGLGTSMWYEQHIIYIAECINTHALFLIGVYLNETHKASISQKSIFGNSAVKICTILLSTLSLCLGCTVPIKAKIRRSELMHKLFIHRVEV